MTRCFNVRYDGEISHVEAESNGPLSLGSQHRDLLISSSPLLPPTKAPWPPHPPKRNVARHDAQPILPPSPPALQAPHLQKPLHCPLPLPPPTLPAQPPPHHLPLPPVESAPRTILTIFTPPHPPPIAELPPSRPPSTVLLPHQHPPLRPQSARSARAKKTLHQ